MKSVLSRCNLLKNSPEEYFRKLHVTPDRTPEERKEHPNLVSKIKRRIECEPERYHYIKDRRVISVDKRLTTSNNIGESANCVSCVYLFCVCIDYSNWRIRQSPLKRAFWRNPRRIRAGKVHRFYSRFRLIFGII